MRRIQMVSVIFIRSSTASGYILNTILTYKYFMWCSTGKNTGTPFIFFYVIDMPRASSNKLLLCADDSAILVEDIGVSNIENILQN